MQDGPPPRIWWCVSGAASFLPIHAAGIYDKDEPGHAISDFVISSYTPSLSALIEARDKVLHRFQDLLTIDSSTFTSLKPEVDRKHQVVHRAYIHNLRREEATIPSVLDAMKTASWVHLTCACRTYQHNNCHTKSAFRLCDGEVYLSRLIEHTFPHADMATHFPGI
jgi:hypothetical protein